MVIGILGGGQLARMLIESCYKYNFEFKVLSKEDNSPAGKITRYEMTGDWNDEECVKAFSSNCDIITLENEFIDYENIEFIEKLGKTVYPSSQVVKLIQDKLIQKQTLRDISIPVADFIEVKSRGDIVKFAEEENYPVILKSRTMGYDGKGNYKVDNEEDIEKAMTEMGKRGELMCEKFIDFSIELAIQGVRNPDGKIEVYPVVESIQENHICNIVKASRDRFAKYKPHIEEISKKILEKLDYVGVMGIEMFLKEDGSILVNELAPRVHNTGHYTIEGCYTSQFENHIRAILNLPLGITEMVTDSAVMINILGEKNSPAKLVRMGALLENEKVYLHDYGKAETRVGRKMGHITVLGEDLEETLEKAKKCREVIDI